MWARIVEFVYVEEMYICKDAYRRKTNKSCRVAIFCITANLVGLCFRSRHLVRFILIIPAHFMAETLGVMPHLPWNMPPLTPWCIANNDDSWYLGGSLQFGESFMYFAINAGQHTRASMRGDVVVLTREEIYYQPNMENNKNNREYIWTACGILYDEII